MGRKPRNRASDAVLMFWMNLSADDKLDCVIEMMRYLAQSHMSGIPASIQPKKSKPKGGEKDQSPPLQSHVVA